MKVLFVSSGKLGHVSALVKNQGDSIRKMGVDVDYFVIGSGFWGYLTGIFKIRKIFKTGNYDLIHAHYSLSAFVASLAGKFPLVVSLLGSDAFKPPLIHFITRLFQRYRWKATIVKTKEMYNLLCLENAHIIPNGVNTERFKPIPKDLACNRIGLSKNNRIAIFIADPARHEKNYLLAKHAVELFNQNEEYLELMTVYNVPNENIPIYINAADVLILTSKREGGVNVIKEAMACNIPFVSTDVGDVKDNSLGVKGCFICEQTPESLALGLKKALEIGVSEGRNRIFELGLDSDSVAKKIIAIYEQTCRI